MIFELFSMIFMFAMISHVFMFSHDFPWLAWFSRFHAFHDFPCFIMIFRIPHDLSYFSRVPPSPTSLQHCKAMQQCASAFTSLG